MLSWLIPVLNFLGGPAINGLVDAYKEKLKAQGATDTLATNLAVKDLEAQIEARKQATALAGTPYGAFVQVAFALPLAFYMGKIYVWDAALGLGTSDPVKGDASVWANLVVAFYFGGLIVSNVTTKVVTALTRFRL